MDIAISAGILVVGVVLALVIAVAIHRKQLANAFETAQAESKKILEDARRESDRIAKDAMREARAESQKRRQAFENEAKQHRGEIGKLESKLKDREKTLEKKLAILDKRESDFDTRQDKLTQDEQRYKKLVVEYEQLLDQTQRTLQNIASMSPEEARRELMRTLEHDARKAAQETIRRIEADARTEAESRAKSVISLAVQRVSSEYVNDTSVSVVALPSDDMKGRIIGREGRNIRAIEQSTGVDLIIDDTPEAVIISCFNPIRREVAKIALERLVGDGRIHPARIEETVKRVESEFQGIVREHGEQAAFDSGITDLHPELLSALGRLRYRSTGHQSVLQHCVEVAQICRVMASELGLNVKTAKRCGLLHDIGKAVDQETEGHHAEIGADFCEKHGETPLVAETIRLHHSDNLSYASPYAVALHAANMLSENRPGARTEQMESYISRLDEMEKLVQGFEGIDSAYVMQAGREVRALVTPTGVTDQEAVDLSNDIASTLRKELTFPGHIRVTVVRESKAVEFAK